MGFLNWDAIDRSIEASHDGWALGLVHIGDTQDTKRLHMHIGGRRVPRQNTDTPRYSVAFYEPLNPEEVQLVSFTNLGNRIHSDHCGEPQDPNEKVSINSPPFLHLGLMKDVKDLNQEGTIHGVSRKTVELLHELGGNLAEKERLIQERLRSGTDAATDEPGESFQQIQATMRETVMTLNKSVEKDRDAGVSPQTSALHADETMILEP